MTNELKTNMDTDTFWTTVNGVMVARIDNSDVVAVPCTEGNKKSRKFDIIDIVKGEYLTQVDNSEVWGQLYRRI